MTHDYDEPIEDAEVVSYTAPEKIASVARAVMAKPSADPKVAALLSVLSNGLVKRLVTNPALAMLPPMDEPEEWDAWLAMLVGVALNLTSDGVELDVDVCRAGGAELLGKLFA